MINILKRELIYIWYYLVIQFREIFLYWVIGMAIGSLISALIEDRSRILSGRMEGAHPGIPGILSASLLGIVNPLGIPGTLPITASCSRQGMRQDRLAAFMMSSVLLSPQLILYSMALGAKALAVRVVSCLLCSFTAGLLVHFLFGNKPFFDFSGFDEQNVIDSNPNFFHRFLKYFGRSIRKTGPWFLAGVFAAVFFRLYLPQGIIRSVFGEKRAAEVLAGAAIGLPFHACGCGSIPLLRQWMLKGMSTGSAAAFMLTGPSTGLMNLGTARTVLGMKKYLAYVLFIIVFAFITGMITNLLV